MLAHTVGHTLLDYLQPIRSRSANQAGVLVAAIALTSRQMLLGLIYQK